MEEYPDEIRIRPVPLVAFMGAGADLASAIERCLPLTKRHASDPTNLPPFRIASFELREPLPTQKKSGAAPGLTTSVTLPPGSPNPANPPTGLAPPVNPADGSRRVSQDHSSLTREPIGILKANWLSKVRSRRFAAVVAFIDWDAADFKTREPEIYAAIDALKVASRNVQVALALMKKDTLVDVNDERYLLFKKRVNIDSKLIFSFLRDDIQNSSTRLESVASRMCADYFDAEIKYLKKQKERLIKSMHQKLYARNHFKIAYFSEFRNDPKTALKYYYSCYGYLKDAKKTPSEYLEFKTLADFVNFKVCWLYLERGTINDAVSHFHRHVAYFRSLVEPEREFLHLHWLSRQYRIFGELLEAFPTQISPPPRPRGWLHPGFYFQTGASLQLERAKIADRICSPQKQDPSMVALVQKVKPFSMVQIDPTKQKYVGQRFELLALDMPHPLQSGPGEAPPAFDDSMTAAEAVRVAVAQELNVSHAELAIELLKRAQVAYELDLFALQVINPGVVADRTHLFILAQLGHLYAREDHFEKAMELLSAVSRRYRKEHWWDLLTDALTDMLYCSKKRGNAAEFVHFSLELMYKQMKSSDAAKKSIQKELLSLFRANPGAGMPVHNQPLVVAMTFGHPLVMCQVQFETDTASVHAEVKFNVVLQVDFPDAVRFSRLKVNFTNPSHNQRLIDSEAEDWSPNGMNPQQLSALASNPSNLLFVPSKQKVFKFGFVVRDQTRIQCAAVILEFGKKPNSLRFQWDVLNQHPNRAERRGSFSSYPGMSVSPHVSGGHHHHASSANSTNATPSALSPAMPHSVSLGTAAVPLTASSSNGSKRPHSRNASGSKFDFLQPQRSSIEILEHEAFLEIEIDHEEPALVKEFYPIRIVLTNKHDKIIAGKLHFQNLTDHKDRCFFSTTTSEDGTSIKVPIDELELRPIETGATDNFLIHFYPKSCDDRALKIKATYDTEKYSTHCEKVINVPVKQPLLASFELYSSQFKLIPPASAAPVASLVSSNLADTVLLSGSTTGTSSAATNVIVGGPAEPKKLIVGEPFFLRVDLQSSVSFTLQVLKIDLLSLSGSNGQVVENSSSYSADSGVIDLPKDDKYSLWFSLTPLVGGNIDLGSLLVEWRRRSTLDPSPNATITKLDIPAAPVEKLSYEVSVTLPFRAFVGQPFEHEIIVKNLTESVQEFSLVVDSGSGDDFAVAGDVELTFKIPARDSVVLRHTLLPLRIGRSPLPSFFLQLVKSGRDYPKLAEPRYVFVEPAPSGGVPLLI